MAIIRVCTRQYKLGKVYIHQRRYWARLTIDSRISMLATGLLSLAISSQHFGEIFGGATSATLGSACQEWPEILWLVFQQIHGDVSCMVRN